MEGLTFKLKSLADKINQIVKTSSLEFAAQDKIAAWLEVFTTATVTG
jgi:hypothetical protein